MLSIITITYLDPIGLKKTISSLRDLKKHHLNFEHIIVDSSPHVTQNVLKDLHSWRVTHIVRSPDGIYSAMNSGITQAKGDFLWFLNGGDALFSVDHLITSINLLKHHPEYSAICGAAVIEKNGKYCYTLYPRKTWKSTIISGRSACHQAIIYRKEVFDKLGNYLERFTHASDEEIHLRLLLSGFNVLCVNKKLVIYNNEGISRKHFKLRYKEIDFIRKNIIKNHLPLLEYSLYSINYFRNLLRMKLIDILEHTFLKPSLRPLWLFWLRLIVKYR